MTRHLLTSSMVKALSHDKHACNCVIVKQENITPLLQQKTRYVLKQKKEDMGRGEALSLTRHTHTATASCALQLAPPGPPIGQPRAWPAPPHARLCRLRLILFFTTAASPLLFSLLQAPSSPTPRFYATNRAEPTAPGRLSRPSSPPGEKGHPSSHMRNSEKSSPHSAKVVPLGVHLLPCPRGPGASSRLQLASEKQGPASLSRLCWDWGGWCSLWESRCEDCVVPLECDTRRVRSPVPLGWAGIIQFRSLWWGRCFTFFSSLVSCCE